MAKRVGENGKIFEMCKFRTMFVDAAKHQAEVTAENANGRKIYKIKDDPRVTKVGKWLRRWSLDELPQLFNVIKGEMSLVGPRPEQPFITQEVRSLAMAKTTSAARRHRLVASLGKKRSPDASKHPI